LPPQSQPRSVGGSEAALGASSSPVEAAASAQAALHPAQPASQPLDLTLSSEKARSLAGVGSLTRDDLRQRGAVDTTSAVQKALKQAETPSCLKANALKHEPPNILGVGVSGILVIPSWITATAKGKCIVR
jgi:hypothetical protein